MVGRIAVAVPMALVAGFLLAFLAATVAGPNQPAPWAFYLGVVGMVIMGVLWVRNSPTVRVTFRRALLTVAVESFALPLAGFVYAAGGLAQVGSAPEPDAMQAVGALVGGGVMTALLGCVGFTLGIFCLVLYVALRAEPQSPKAQAT